jgi:hypothetical protein
MLAPAVDSPGAGAGAHDGAARRGLFLHLLGVLGSLNAGFWSKRCVQFALLALHNAYHACAEPDGKTALLDSKGASLVDVDINLVNEAVCIFLNGDSTD